MSALPESDQKHFQAAQGWVTLGSLTEATAELEKIDPEMRAHPNVLELRIEIFLLAKHLTSAFEVADTLVRLVPHRLRPWLARSEALHGMGRTLDASRQLVLALGGPVSNRWEIKYALAQYACQEKRFSAAYAFLKDALDSEGSREFRLRALDDPMLAELWKTIGSIPE